MKTLSERKQIADKYWNTDMTLEQIARRHRTQAAAVTNIAKQFPMMNSQENNLIRIFNEKNIIREYAVIKVEAKWIEGISHLLETRGIPFEIPKNFELIETIESKINESTD